jgi:phosphoglycerate dehydrogenase-like enzyme
MRENATFINTGRGGQVDQQGLVRAMRDRPDLTALLDVTVPEPLPDESELFTLPNVTLTTHIAGALGNEVVAMADFVIDEFLRWQDGKPLSDPIRLEDLDSMA